MNYYVTYRETTIKTKTGMVRAKNLDEANQKAESKYGYDQRSDGMGGAYGVEVLDVQKMEEAE
jgi:hypothetical protein